MNGPFGWACMEDVRDAGKGLFAAEPCTCRDCQSAGINKPSVLAFEEKDAVRDGRGNIRERHMGRWLHGVELKLFYQARAAARQKISAVIAKSGF